MAKSPERPHTDLDLRHLELGVRAAQSNLKRSRIMRSDAAGLVEVVVRGDLMPSRVRIKDRAALGIDDQTADRLESALEEAWREAGQGAYEEQRRQYADLLPTQGAELAAPQTEDAQTEKGG